MNIEDWRARGRTVSVEGWRIFYVDSASGRDDTPAILMLHGFPTSGWDWQKIWDVLADGRRLIAPDMIGFGYSEKRRRHAYSIMEQADLMEGLVEVVGIGRYHILAHDYGDTVAQEMIARDNARDLDKRRIRSVCLLNGGLFPETHRARLIQKLLLSPLGPLINLLTTRRTFDRSFSAIFGPDTQPSKEELDAFWALINEDGGRFLFHKLITYMRDRRQNRQRWVDALVDFPGPIQLINGSLDPVSGAHMVARYRELVGRGDIVELPEIGHYPQVEAPEEVVRHYKRFLSSQRNE